MRARAKVLLTPMGSQIKYQVVGRIVCSWTPEDFQELPNSRALAQDDLVWRSVFGSEREVARFLKRNKQTSKIVSLEQLGYDPCDHLQ
jgi:hypothetical protein